LPVFVLFVVGGEVVRDFCLTLMMGIIVGTYSSWFVASPIILEWEKRSPKRFK
jgi:preprotein translocase subunit SecF